MTELKIKSERRDNGAVLAIAGSVSVDDGLALESEVARVVEGKPRIVAVDLTGLDFISSVGIAALVTLHRRVHSYGGAARIVGPTTNVFGVLDRARLVELMPVCRSVEQALGG